MGFWSDLFGFGSNHEGVIPNSNPDTSVGGDGWNPGDPDGFEVEPADEEMQLRSLPFPQPSPWSGWPAGWSTPGWTSAKLGKLVDTAWDCLDLNASILSTMPVYRTRQGAVMTEPRQWMTNPDPTVYASWQEFAKQLFWDYQMGEAFVLSVARYSDTGYPMFFRVVPPGLVHVEYVEGMRRYYLGGRGTSGTDVSGDILHIRYHSSTDPLQPRGVGPLEVGGARMVTVGLLQRYVDTLATNGGRTLEWITSDQKLTATEANEMQRDFVEAKRRQFAEPAVFGKGGELKQAQSMSAKDMALLELAQWSESRICVKLRVPPVMMALPSAGDSLTYANVSQLYDFHDRAGLRTFAGAVMPALSNWLLPAGQQVELNRDEYSRPGLKDRADAYAALIANGVLRPEEARVMERLNGTDSATSLTGGDQS